MVAMFQRYFDAVEAQAVTAASRTGRSWQEIFEVLGSRKQSVWEKRRRMEETVRSRDWIEFGATGSENPKP